MTIYGYARVSSDGQSVAAQEGQLRAAGCAKVYAEKISGKGTGGRVELAKALKRLAEGDVLIVTRLDRLARSTRDLLNILHDLADRHHQPAWQAHPRRTWRLEGGRTPGVVQIAARTRPFARVSAALVMLQALFIRNWQTSNTIIAQLMVS